MKKVLSVLLATLILLGLCVGCGNKPEPDPSKDNDVSTGTSVDENPVEPDDSTDASVDASVDESTDESTDESVDESTDESTDASADVSDDTTAADDTTATEDDKSTTKDDGKKTTTKEDGKKTTTKDDGKKTTTGKTGGKTSKSTKSTTKAVTKSTTKAGTKSTTKATTKSTTKAGTTTTTTKGQAGPVRTTKTNQTTTTTSMTKTTVNTDNEKTLFDQIPESLSKQKLKMLIWWPIMDGDYEHTALFTEKTGIKVTYETVNAENYQTRLSAMIMSNNSPSCAAMIAEWYPQPITRGLLQPLKNVPGWDFTEDIYATSLMDEFAYMGEHYALTLKGSVNPTFTVMFFNRELMKQFGVVKDPYQLWKEGNWNWDTCLEVAQKCTDTSKGMYGMTITWQYWWMVSAGQDFVEPSKDGLVNNIKNPEILKAWTHAWRMINEYKVVDPTFTGATPFYARTSAMYAAGSYELQNNQPTYPPAMMEGTDWSVVPFPSPAGQKPIAVCDGTVWGFPSRVTGDKLQAAAWLLRYWLDDAQFKEADFYTKEESWEVMNWMWEQEIESFNSMGILGYGGEYNAANMQPYIMGDGLAAIKSNLDSWYGVAQSNIEKIETEMPSPT